MESTFALTEHVIFTMLDRKQIFALFFIFRNNVLHKHPCKRSFRTKDSQCLHSQDLQKHVTGKVKGSDNSHLR